MENKKFFHSIIIVVSMFLLGFGSITVFVDPYFHYHKPLFNYYLYNQRYQNDGILKHFDYDAIIIGTSMVENTMASQVNSLFNVSSVKTCFEGASFKEINDRLDSAFNKNKSIKLVIRGLDLSKLLDDKDYMRYDRYSYPNYLYDNNYFNDANYVFNKEVLIRDVFSNINNNINKIKSTSFDEYSYWADNYEFSKESVERSYVRKYNKDQDLCYSDEDRMIEIENLYQNVIDIAIRNPKTIFYYFITPYSIYYYDDLNQNGNLKRILEAEEVAIKELIKQENIYLFSFSDCFEMVSDLNNYKDIWHYSDEINSYIIESMANNKHRVTDDNVENILLSIKNYYLNYRYDDLLFSDK